MKHFFEERFENNISELHTHFIQHFGCVEVHFVFIGTGLSITENVDSQPTCNKIRMGKWDKRTFANIIGDENESTRKTYLAILDKFPVFGSAHRKCSVRLLPFGVSS